MTGYYSTLALRQRDRELRPERRQPEPVTEVRPLIVVKRGH